MAQRDIWDTDRLAAVMAPLLPEIAVEVVEEIDSSNTELMRRGRAGQLAPVLLVAERQTAGRGRLGRLWQSAQRAEDPASLTFSLGLPLAPRDWSGLSLAVGVSVAESLDPQRAARLALKWPNDLWIDDCKLGGILIETALPQVASGDAASRWLVIGLGLNVGPRGAVGLSTAPAWVQQWLSEATPSTVLQMLIAPLLRDVLAFEARGFTLFAERFAARDALQGREVQLNDGTVGRCTGVGWGGELRVHTESGMQSISSSEVSVRPRGIAA
jgi:BirA family biotin operon repressor/biotin-[acetyl-CoA-carboxylase] ligase